MNTADDAETLAGLLQFFYQCPVGLLEIDDEGTVEKINPAAARMLAPALAGHDLTQLFPVLEPLAPELVTLIRSDPTRLGPLSPGHRILVPADPRFEHYLECLPVRVDAGRVMVVLVDVSSERLLARREHAAAVQLQQSMLGRIDPVPGLPIGVRYRTADLALEVGGDWYDVIALPDGLVGLVVGDVVGHNVGAAAAMGQLRSAIRAMAPWCPDPADLLQRASETAANIDGAECATVEYVVLDPDGGQVRYACAGHPYPLLVRRDGTAEYLRDGRGLPLACGVPIEYRTASASLAPDDLLILYTDGLFERRGPEDDRLDELLATAVRHRHLPPSEIADRLVADMLDGRRADDDQCALVVRRPPVRTARRPGVARPRQAGGPASLPWTDPDGAPLPPVR